MENQSKGIIPFYAFSQLVLNLSRLILVFFESFENEKAEEKAKEKGCHPHERVVLIFESKLPRVVE